ncbi:MAG: hypothetical protein ACI89X_002847 [Planctomycetota bacterium]
MLLLPSLVVGLSVGTPAQPDELARLQRIVERGPRAGRIDTSGSRMFHVAAIPDATWPVVEAEQSALIVRARLMQVLGITALAFLTYLSVLLARGRLQALFACGLIAALPPVAFAGHILRPETPATLFALLSLVLLQVASRPAPRHRYRSPRRSMMVGGALMLCASMAAAMACEAMPSAGAILLVPGVVLLAGTVQLANRGIRCFRRRALIGTPIRSLNRRLIPWTATALVAPAITWWLLSSTLNVSVDHLAVTERASSLLPESSLGYAVSIGLLAVGLIAGVLRVGIRFGRGARIGPDLILLLFCAVFLITSMTGEGLADPLPLLPAMAVLLSEGLCALLVLTLGLLARRRS